jgi:protein-S-isoprenylcysteine O-methyltransferase Ste14
MAYMQYEKAQSGAPRSAHVLKKPILAAAAIGAAAGVKLAHLDGRIIGRFAFFSLDQALRGHRAFLLLSIAGWALFSLYWEAAAKNASQAASSESKASRAVHVSLVNIAFLFEILPIQAFGRYLPASPLIMTAGLSIEAAGLLLAIWARRHLGRHWSGEITIKLEHQLIRSGPYRLLRHPIYTGLLAMYLGVALVTGERLALLGLAVAVFAYTRKIRLEEANLHLAFGGRYEAYKHESWALIPGIF